jgi:REP element-mobilizing transposase RayT
MSASGLEMQTNIEEPNHHKRFRQQIRAWLQSKPVGQAFQPAILCSELRHFNKADLASVSFCRRRLPHWELEGSTYFVTYRLIGALPCSLVERVSKTEFCLASIVEESLFFNHGERFLLDAYVIMPDHVHLLIRPIAEWSLSRILQGLKGFTAREINKILHRYGAFWQDESFDHLVRNDEDWLDKFTYIHDNPVKAGVVLRPQDYPYSSLVTMYSIGRLESLPHMRGRQLHLSGNR